MLIALLALGSNRGDYGRLQLHTGDLTFSNFEDIYADSGPGVGTPPTADIDVMIAQSLSGPDPGLSTTPEPGIFVLLGGALMGLGAIRRRRAGSY